MKETARFKDSTLITGAQNELCRTFITAPMFYIWFLK